MTLGVLNVLKKRSEYLAVASHRKKWVTPAFILQVSPRPNEDGSIGYGLTASKKMVGNAVQRNRAKRRLRALLREVFPNHARMDTNYIFIARKDVLTLEYKTLRQDLEKALKRMKLWQGEE